MNQNMFRVVSWCKGMLGSRANLVQTAQTNEEINDAVDDTLDLLRELLWRYRANATTKVNIETPRRRVFCQDEWQGALFRVPARTAPQFAR